MGSEKQMKLLYGSQNFGYDLPDSDKDWFEIVYPTWDDIVSLKVKSVEHIETNNEHTKIKDIRLLPTLLESANFSWTQILYSKLYIDCEDLQWFINNRDRITRYNIYKSYKSNSGFIISKLTKSSDTKTLTRCYAFRLLLTRLLDTNNEFDLCNHQTRNFRLWVDKLNDKQRDGLAGDIIKETKSLEESFLKFSDTKDTEIIDSMNVEIKRLLKTKLLEEHSNEK